MGDVPFPYREDSSSLGNSSQSSNYFGVASMGGFRQPLHHHQPTPKLKDPREWEQELVTDLWKRGQPQILQCVSTLVMSVICAFDARHVLVNRDNHGSNDFGIGNALFPPHDNNTAAPALQPIHQRLDPSSASAEESWNRRDIWGFLLVPYALLLRNSAAGRSLFSPRGGQSPARDTVGGGIDVKGTFSKCLMVASQLKSLTFARLSLVPSLSSSSSSSPSTSSSFDFYLSTLSEFTAQYINALGSTGNLPITRGEWYDEENNMAQSEYMERDQQRQFGLWAGETTQQEVDGTDSPRAVNILDRPDCLEDVFALVSCVCDVYPAGAKSFWHIVDKEEGPGEEGSSMNEEGSVGRTLVLEPSSTLQMLDILQSASNAAFFVYLSFVATLALADAPGGVTDEGNNGASAVHSFLSGEVTINPPAVAERRIHFVWAQIFSAVRWYAEHLSSGEEGDGVEKKTSRITSTTPTIITVWGTVAALVVVAAVMRLPRNKVAAPIINIREAVITL